MDIAVTTRPVEPADRTLFYRLWPRLSPETVYRRFHAPVHRLPDETVRRLVTVDHDQREAVVAVVGGEVVGVARYDRLVDDPSTAVETTIYRTTFPKSGSRVSGPCIIEFPGQSVVVPPGAQAEADQFGNLHVRLQS